MSGLEDLTPLGTSVRYTIGDGAHSYALCIDPFPSEVL